MNGTTTGTNTAVTKTKAITGLTYGTYNAYAVVYDVAGNSAQTSTIDITLAKITAKNYSGVYDGSAHSATVSCSLSGTTFTYGTTSGSYTLSSMPSYTNAGTYTVYWKATKDSYIVGTGSVTVTITKASSTISLTAKDGYITVTTNSNGTVTATSSNTSIANVTVSGKRIRIVPVTNGSSGTFTVTVKVNEATNYKASSNATQSVTVSSKKITSSVGWYTASDYWSGYYYLSGSTGTWFLDHDSVWHTTSNITLSAGCYYVIGNTGSKPRAVLWNDSSRSGLYTAFTATDGVTIAFTGTKYLQLPIIVNGYSDGSPSDYTSYDVRMITFN